MLPIFLSSHAPVMLIVRILAVKAVYGVLVGFLVDFLFRRLNQRKIGAGIHGICEHEHCNCEESIVKSTVKHTLSITLYIFLVSAALNLILALIGTENLEHLILNKPVIGELLSAMVGLIPNCAASVAITTLYLDGAMSAGAMMSGLLVGAGIGLLVLFRTNRSRRENWMIAGILYAAGVAGGILTGALRLI